MTRILKICDLFCGIGAALACIAFAALAIMLIIEVITTSFLAYSQPWAVEYSAYFLAATLFAGSGWALGQGAHIRVAVLLQLFPDRLFRIIDLAISLFALAVAVYVAAAVVQNAHRSFELGSVSFYPTRTPIWLPQAMLAFSWVVLCLGLLARILRLATGRPAEVASQGTVS